MANYFGFIDESGVLDESSTAQPYFAVGLLKIKYTGAISEKLSQRHYDYFSVQKDNRKKLFADLKTNPKTLTHQELNILLSSTRHYEYKFTNVTTKTLERYKSLLDTAFRFPFDFYVLLIDKTSPLFKSTLRKNYWTEYVEYSKLLCEKKNKATDQLCIIADYSNRPHESDIFFEEELNKLPAVSHSIRAHSETFMLLQLCDLLLGSVIFQWKQKNGFVSNSNRAKAKKEFVEYLMTKLDIPKNKKSEFPLAQAVVSQTDLVRFEVWPYKHP